MPTERIIRTSQGTKTSQCEVRTVSSFPKRILTSLSVVMAAGLMAPPAQAYYLGYSPYGFGGYWGWPLTSALYSLTSPFYSYGRAMTYPFRWNGSTGYYHSPNYWNPVPPNYMYTDNYQDSEPAGDPRYRVRSFRPSPYPADQIAYAGWSRGQSQAGMRAQDQALLNGANSALNPNQAPAAVAAAPPSQGSPQFPLAQGQGQTIPALGMATVPPVAPPVVIAPGSPFAPPSSPAVTSPLQGPLAKMFVDRVNKKFKGNIKNALFDPETRSIACAIGLIGPDEVFDADLGKAHLELAKRILQDSSLDPQRKLDTIRALFKR